MKKSELTQITQIIEHLVAREIRKQLPTIIAETFQNMMGKQVVTEKRQQPQPIMEHVQQQQEIETEEEHPNFKASLRDLFAGTPVMRRQEEQVAAGPRPMKQFAKNPVLNQILNETTSDLRDRERLVGAAAFQGGYSPTLDLIPGFNPQMASVDMGSVEESSSPSFSRMPSMPGMSSVPQVPINRPPVLAEGQESSYAPMAALPNGISALDLSQQAPAPVARALTRNYSQMMKLIDKKKGKV